MPPEMNLEHAVIENTLRFGSSQARVQLLLRDLSKDLVWNTGNFAFSLKMESCLFLRISQSTPRFGLNFKFSCFEFVLHVDSSPKQADGQERIGALFSVPLCVHTFLQ